MKIIFLLLIILSLILLNGCGSKIDYKSPPKDNQLENIVQENEEIVSVKEEEAELKESLDQVMSLDLKDETKKCKVLSPIKNSKQIEICELLSYYKFINQTPVYWDNKKKKTAWKESSIMASLAEMYEFRKKTWYLDQLIIRVSTVLKMRNDFRSSPKKDYILKKVTATWPQFNADYKVNGKKRYFSNVVQTGMIIYPIAWAARIILERPDLHDDISITGESYLKVAKRFVKRVQESINVFNSNKWFNKKKHLYHYPNNRNYRKLSAKTAGRFLPYNRMMAMGRALIEMANSYRLLKRRGDLVKEYNKRIARMINYFMNRLVKNGKKKRAYYLWGYDAYQNKYEDISHGGIDVQFLILANKNRFKVSNTDLRRVSNTFSRKIILNKKYDLAWRVNGSIEGMSRKSRNKRCGRWLDFSKWNKSVFKACAFHYSKGIHEYKGLGYVKMLRWKAKNNKDPFLN